MENKKGQALEIIGIILICTIVIVAIVTFSIYFGFGWDTGTMVGTVIGYDSNFLGTKTVFVLEKKTLMGDQGLSQSEIHLCSDAEDTHIHELVEQYINKEVVIEYKNRRVGFKKANQCSFAPITNIKLYEE